MNNPPTRAMTDPYGSCAPFRLGQITADSANGWPAMTRSTPKIRSIDELAVADPLGDTTPHGCLTSRVQEAVDEEKPSVQMRPTTALWSRAL